MHEPLLQLGRTRHDRADLGRVAQEAAQELLLGIHHGGGWPVVRSATILEVRSPSSLSDSFAAVSPLPQRRRSNASMRDLARHGVSWIGLAGWQTIRPSTKETP
jgi:hypothetical protein